MYKKALIVLFLLIFSGCAVQNDSLLTAEQQAKVSEIEDSFLNSVAELEWHRVNGDSYVNKEFVLHIYADG